MENILPFNFHYIHGRPMIMAKLGVSPESSRYFRLLIDSGADYTIISQKDAILLGLDYRKMRSPEIKVEVANLTSIHAKKTTLWITIETVELRIPVLVTKEEVECLLGRKGVFDYFDVTFQEGKEQVLFTCL